MDLRCFKNRVKAAEQELRKARVQQERAEALARLLDNAGVQSLPLPEFRSLKKGAVCFCWPLFSTFRTGCANGCGYVAVTYMTDRNVVWCWGSHEILVQHYPGSGMPLVRYTPEFVGNVPETRVVSKTVPPEFIAFVDKHRELMFSPEEQRKRNRPGVLIF